MVGILSQITPVISYAGIRKRNAGLPSSVTAACSLFSSTVKRDHKMKRHNSGIFPAALAAHLGHFPLLFYFFFPQCVEKEQLLCANAAMKPGLTNVLLSVALGITSPQIFYSIIHGTDFAVLLSVIDQDPSILHPLEYAYTKKGSHQTLDFTRLKKHLQDLHSLKYQVLPFLFYLTGCFS